MGGVRPGGKDAGRRPGAPRAGVSRAGLHGAQWSPIRSVRPPGTEPVAELPLGVGPPHNRRRRSASGSRSRCPHGGSRARPAHRSGRFRRRRGSNRRPRKTAPPPALRGCAAVLEDPLARGSRRDGRLLGADPAAVREPDDVTHWTSSLRSRRQNTCRVQDSSGGRHWRNPPIRIDRDRRRQHGGSRGSARQSGDLDRCFELSKWLTRNEATDLRRWSSPPRKRGARACPWLEQGATAVRLGPWVPAFAEMDNKLMISIGSFRVRL